MRPFSLAATLAAMVLCAPALASTCFDSSGDGRIEGAVALPLAEPNFAAYSELGL